MDLVEKTVDAGGGALVGGAKGVAYGIATAVAVGAVIGGALAISGGIAAFLTGAAIGAAVGGVAGGAFSAQVGGAIGFIGGLFKGLNKSKGDPVPALEQQRDDIRAENAQLTAHIIEQRRQAAGGFNNPQATADHVAKVAAGKAQAQTTANTPA